MDKNVQKVISLLERAYMMELETVANYLANSVHLDGVQAEEIKEALANDVAEELGHARKIAQRIKQLGGRVPGSLDLVRSQETLQPPAQSTDIRAVVDGVVDAEHEAIEQYRLIIRESEGSDYVTQDLAIKIMADEEQHRVQFEGFRAGFEAALASSV